MPKDKTDLSLLADRFLAFFAYELADQTRFNKWIENMMTNRERNPGALVLLNLLLNKALPTPHAVKMSAEEGFTLSVKYESSAGTPQGGPQEFTLTFPLPQEGDH